MKKHSYFPFYWLFDRDPYNGLLSYQHHWIVQSPIYPKQLGFLFIAHVAKECEPGFANHSSSRKSSLFHARTCTVHQRSSSVPTLSVTPSKTKRPMITPMFELQNKKLFPSLYVCGERQPPEKAKT